MLVFLAWPESVEVSVCWLLPAIICWPLEDFVCVLVILCVADTKQGKSSQVCVSVQLVRSISTWWALFDCRVVLSHEAP